MLTFGSTQGSIPLAAGGAAAALVVVAGAGVLVAPRSRGCRRTRQVRGRRDAHHFGTFWAAEGAGADWPGSDAAILGVLAFVIGLSAGLVALLRRRPRPRQRCAA